MSPEQAFEVALAFTLRKDVEGGYVNDPDDPGGATNQGITQNTYSDWLKSHSMPNADVRHISSQEVHDIYYEWFWKRPNIDMLAQGTPATAAVIFDWGLNIGPKRPIQSLQRRIGIVPDGVIGAITARSCALKAQMVGGDLDLAKQVLADRQAWYEANSKPKFIHGLTNRVNNLRSYLDTAFEQVNNGTDYHV